MRASRRRSRPGRSVIYFCLQPTREGQASHAHVWGIVGGLASRGWRVVVVEPTEPRAGRFDAVRRVAAILWATLRLVGHVAVVRPDAVYIRAHFAALPASGLLRLLPMAVVQEVNGPVSDAYDAWPWLRPGDGLLRRSEAVQLRWATRVVAVTPELAEYVKQAAPRSSGVSVIGNGASPERFERADAAPTRARPYVVFVGALARWQGIGMILEAVQQPQWLDGVDLVVAGDGADRAQVARASGSGGVVWLGRIPFSDVPPLLAGASAALVVPLVSPRGRIGHSPVKLFEAMAAGVPVVVSDMSGLADIVREAGCGVVVRPGDPGAVAEGVAYICGDHRRASQMGESGRAAVRTRYSWDARSQAAAGVLREAIRAQATRKSHSADTRSSAGGVTRGATPSKLHLMDSTPGEVRSTQATGRRTQP